MFRTVYTMAGKGGFPLDMLRRDKSFPHTSQDAVTIGSSMRNPVFSGQLQDLPQVTLCHYHTEPGWTPDLPRWGSFGWGPVEVQPAEKAEG